jgi:hypothetical protein
MTGLAPPISILFICPRHGSTTCAMIKAYFLTDIPFAGLTGYIMTRLVVVVVVVMVVVHVF